MNANRCFNSDEKWEYIDNIKQFIDGKKMLYKYLTVMYNAQKMKFSI